MVLKFGSEPDEVYMLEATTDLGVCIRNFADIIPEIGGHYTKVALRHIEWQRSNASLDILQKFLEEVQGRDYNLTLDMVLRKTTRNIAPLVNAAPATNNAE